MSLEQNELLASEIKFQAGLAKTRLPRGAIHGDLFCDNVLFDRGRVSGIIDFGFAATDALAYDLAIAVNDWCSVSEGASAGALDLPLSVAMVAAYEEVRPLSAEERALAGVAARRGIAILVVSPLRSLPATLGGADARARSCPIRADTSPSRCRPMRRR